MGMNNLRLGEESQPQNNILNQGRTRRFCRSCLAYRVIILILGVALLGFMVQESQAQQASLVKVEKVHNVPLTQTVSVIGRMVALRTGNVAARIAGPVEQMLVNVGDRVEAGQVMAHLNSDTSNAELALAKSEVAEAKADLTSWKAEADIARVELNRQIRLKKSTAFSQAKFEDSQTKLAAAEAKVKRAEAQIAIKQAGLKRKAIDVKYSMIKAPYSGMVVQKFTDVGAYMRSGDPLVKLIGDEQLEIEADIPANRLVGLTPQREIKIQLDDGSAYKAAVRSILPSENPLTRTRTVRFSPKIKLQGRKKPLAEGQSVTLFVPLGAARDVLSVHKDAILKRGSGDLVFMIIGGKAVPRPVKLGEAVGARVEVLGGLKAGDVVVIRGNERLRPGAPVQISKGSS